jgi:hypothetical protein
MSEISPNIEQFKALAAAAASDTRKVVMLNLLKFRKSDGPRRIPDDDLAARLQESP